MSESLKERIIELRKLGLSYNEIKSELNCTKSIISYHCNRYGLGNPDSGQPLTDDIIEQLNEYYKSHTVKETCEKFNISKTTLHKYTLNNPYLSDNVRKQRNYEHVRTHRQKIKEKSVEYKGGKCEQCGYNKCVKALEFHHLNPDNKDFTVSSYSKLSWDKVQKELDKCAMVCANCHREIHHTIYLDNLNSLISDVNPPSDTRLKG